MGLSALKHLNQNLKDLKPLFQKLEAAYCFHVCGEGGEYESLVLDCPLYQKKLVLDQVQTILQDDHDPMAGGYLKILNCHAECKATEDQITGRSSASIDLPPVHHVTVPRKDKKEGYPNNHNVITHTQLSSKRLVACSGWHYQHGGLIQISQLVSASVFLPSSSTSSDDVAIAEFQNITKQLSDILKETHCTAQDVVMVHLYLSSISLFAKINAHYVSFFGSVLPPSRVCIAVGPLRLLGSRNVAMDCTIQTLSGSFLRGTTNSNSIMTVTSDSKLREVLHVQSRSCWAPCCVGPYSQANTIRDGLVYLAGQVGLIPATMELHCNTSTATSCCEEQLKQCWTNLHSVLDAMGDSSTCTAGRLRNQALCGIVYISSSVSHKEADLWDTLRNISNDAVLNAAFNPGEVDGYHLVKQRRQRLQDNHYEDEETRLADAESSKTQNNSSSASNDSSRVDLLESLPILFVAVPELPVGAIAEVELICISSKAASCLQLKSTSFHTTPSVRQYESKGNNNNNILWEVGYTAAGALSIPAEDVIEVTTTMRYVKGCCAVAGIVVSYLEQKPAVSQQQHNCFSVIHLDLVVREIMNHIQKVAQVSNLFIPTHLSRIRLHFSDEQCQFGDGMVLQRAVHNELTRLVVSQQQNANSACSRISIPSAGNNNTSYSRIPAVTVVPVTAVSNGGLLSVMVEVLDLVHMETELWVKHSRVR